MNLTLSKSFLYWTGVVALGIIVGLSVQFVQAWTAPAGTPPAGNVSAPITTTLDPLNYQYRGAGLGLAASLNVTNVGSQDNAVTSPKFCINNTGSNTDGCITEWPTGSGGACVPIYQENDVRGVRSSANIMYRNDTSDTLTWIIAVGAGSGYGGWPQYGPSGTINSAANTEHPFIDNGTVYNFDIAPGEYYGMSSHGDPRYATVNTWSEKTVVGCAGGGGGVAGGTSAVPWVSWSRASGILGNSGISSVALVSNRPVVTFDTPMPSDKYAVVCNSALGTSGGSEEQIFAYNKTTTGFRLQAAHAAGEDAINVFDCAIFSGAIGGSGGGGDNLGNHIATQNIDMNGAQVTDLGAPVNATDAATKSYVDSVAGSGGGVATYNDLPTGAVAGYCQASAGLQDGGSYGSAFAKEPAYITNQDRAGYNPTGCGCRSGFTLAGMISGYDFICIKN